MTSVATYNKMETSPLLEGTIEIKDYFNKEVSNATNLTELEKNFLSFFALDTIVAEEKKHGFYYGDDIEAVYTDFDEIHAYLNRENVVSKNTVKGILGSLDKKNVIWVEERLPIDGGNLIWLSEDFLTALFEQR
tara:strand:- start:47 stop:448 length:402 start_codon:yes stop_codon:yes gene_type:complete